MYANLRKAVINRQ